MYPDQLKDKQVSLARDTQDVSLQLTPPKVALSQTNTLCASSTTVAVTSGACFIEINAIDDGIFLKWGDTAVTNANFDEFVQAGSTRHYVIPEGVTTFRIIDNGGIGRAILIQK